MDNLQHIDDLLRRASQVPANALVNDSDWEAVEKKLRHRKNRIYAMWFFLALVVTSISAGVLWNSEPETTETLANAPIETNKDILQVEETIDPTQEKSTSDIPETLTESRITTKKVNKHTVTNSTSTNQAEQKLIKDKSQLSFETYKLPALITLSSKTTSLSDYVYSYKHNFGLITELIELDNESSNDSKKNNISNSNHWEVGVAFTPNLSSNKVSENTPLSGLINRNYQNFIGDKETISFSNNFGFNIQYHNKSPFFIGTGIFMTQRAESVDYNYTITEFPSRNQEKPVIDSYSPIRPHLREQISYQGSNSYHFVEIPLNLGFKHTISRNFESRTQLGISYLALLNADGKKGDAFDLSLNDLKDLNLKTQHIATNFKTGLYYHAPRIVFGVEPMVGLNLSSLTDNSTSPIKVKPYSYGLNISTSFKLIKE